MPVFTWLLAMIAILLIPGPTKASWVINDEKEVNGGTVCPLSYFKASFGKLEKDWMNHCMGCF